MRSQLDPVIQAVTRAARHIGAKLPHQQASDVAYSYRTATPGAIAMDQHSMSDWLDRHVPGVLGTPARRLAEREHVRLVRRRHGRAVGAQLDRLLPDPRPGRRRALARARRQRPGHRRHGQRACRRATLVPETPLEAIRRRHDGTYELRLTGVAAAAGLRLRGADHPVHDDALGGLHATPGSVSTPSTASSSWAWGPTARCWSSTTAASSTSRPRSGSGAAAWSSRRRRSTRGRARCCSAVRRRCSRCTRAAAPARRPSPTRGRSTDPARNHCCARRSAGSTRRSRARRSTSTATPGRTGGPATRGRWGPTRRSCPAR